jgi:hypothetical protein
LKFETDVHNGTANVRAVSNRDGGIGGGGFLLPVAVIRGKSRPEQGAAVDGERDC